MYTMFFSVFSESRNPYSRRTFGLEGMLCVVAALLLGWSAPLHQSGLHRGVSHVSRSLSPRCAEDVGSLVVFARRGDPPALGAITAVEPGKKVRLRVIDGAGKEQRLFRSQIKHIVPVKAEPPSQGRIKAHEDAASDALSADFDALQAAWEMLSEKSRQVKIAELSEIIFDAADSRACYATYALLTQSSAGRSLFKASPDGLRATPRTAAEVTRLRAQLAKEAEAAKERAALCGRLNTAAASGVIDLSDEPELIREALHAISRLGCRPELDVERSREEPEPTDKLARVWLRELGRKATAEGARQLMVELGLWSVHENLELIAHRVPLEFDEPVLAEAAAALETPPEDVDVSRRRDLRHLRAFAIDSTSTVEVDDAISIEYLDADSNACADGVASVGSGRVRLWVHVADATRYVDLSGALGTEARKRGSSIYLPTGTIPMLPLDLAAGPLSLRPEVDSCALSIGVTLQSDGSIVQKEIIVTPSLIRAERLTYEKVDQMLDEESKAEDAEAVGVLEQLAAAAQLRLEYRIAGGSMESIAPTSLPDMNIKVIPDTNLSPHSHADLDDEI